jgi:hypothetical protein
LPTPYSYIRNAGTQLYTFTTDQGLEYSCIFGKVPLLDPMIEIYDLEVRDFSFYPYDPNPAIRKHKDQRILPTLMAILNEFFSDPTRILVFVCDDNEGEVRAAARLKLFTEWHEAISELLDLHELEIEIEAEGKTLYGGIVHRRDCPHLPVVREHLLEKSADIIFEKYGY